MGNDTNDILRLVVEPYAPVPSQKILYLLLQIALANRQRIVNCLTDSASLTFYMTGTDSASLTFCMTGTDS